MALAILKNCRDEHKLPDVISSTHGIGVTFKDEKNIEYTTIPDNSKSGARRLNASVSSWRGISMGAVHYYGKITCYDPSLKYTDENGKEHISSIGGYFNRHKPIECQSFEIELVRELTQEEIDADPERWRSYEAGDLTGCFNTEEEVLNLIKEVFKKRFKGNWEMELGDAYGRTVDKLKKNTKV